MIAQIKGKLIEKTPTYVVIDCNGVGYQLNISLNTFSKIGNDENCLLLTHYVVREDAHLLYGFKEKSERELFRQLISVSGVGSSTAMMILSSLSPEETKIAIISGNVNVLKSVKGIGLKTAERIIIDLRDKVGKSDGTEIFSSFAEIPKSSGGLARSPADIIPKKSGGMTGAICMLVRLSLFELGDGL